MPIATLPGMQRASSAGKTFSFTGWKVGWLHGPEPLVRTVTVPHLRGAPFQPAIADALADDETPRALADSLAARRDLLCEGLVRAGFDVVVPQGTYFVIADGAALGVEDGTALCRELPALAGRRGRPRECVLHPGVDDGARARVARPVHVRQVLGCLWHRATPGCARRVAALSDV